MRKLVSLRLSRFNSPREALCTCPPKYNINPYLGRCGHNCLYCYAVKFPSFNGPLIPRLNLVKSVEDMVRNTHPKLPVMLSDCTDPYQPAEKRYWITRSCIEALTRHGFPVLIVTKSDLVTRDLDILEGTGAVVAITVTSLSDEVVKLVEPNAPPPTARLGALRVVAEHGLTAVARIDPIIPGLNDDEKDLELLVQALKSIGVKHVTVSTLKPVKGFFAKLDRVAPELSRSLRKLYAGGDWKMGYRYLNPQTRQGIVRKLMSIVLKHGLSFASCREGCVELNTTICDGTAFCRGQARLPKLPT